MHPGDQRWLDRCTFRLLGNDWSKQVAKVLKIFAEETGLCPCSSCTFVVGHENV